MFVSFVFLILPILYFYVIKEKDFIKRAVFSLIFFFGINSLYLFFTAYVLGLSISIVGIILANIIYLIYLIRTKKNQYNEEQLQIKNSDIKNKIKLVIDGFPWPSIIVTFIILFISLAAFTQFKNGLRLPIFSSPQDSANHFRNTEYIFIHNKLAPGIYPQGFHANEALLTVSINNLFNHRFDEDLVFRVNMFSLFLVLTIIIFCLVSYYISEKLIEKLIDIKNFRTVNKIIIKIFVAVVTFLFDSIIIFHQVVGGFLSTLYSQIFLLAIVYFLIDRNREYKYLIPLMSGLIFSYAFASPIFLVFFPIYIYLNKQNKDKIIFVSAILTYMLSFAFAYKMFVNKTQTLYLLTAFGGLPKIYYSVRVAFILSYLIFIFITSSKSITIHKQLVSMHLLLFSIIIYLCFLAGIEIIKLGKVMYPYYKIEYMLIAIILVITSIIYVYINIKIIKYIKNKIENEPHPIVLFNFLFFSAFFVLYWLIYNNFTYLQFVVKGNSNFMSNSKYKFNTVVYVLENLKNYDQYIYIDPDFQSSQWGANGLLSESVNVINYNRVDGFNAGTRENIHLYEEVIEKSPKSKKTLIIDPIRQLEIGCISEKIVKIATTSSRVDIYPQFSYENYLKYCVK